MARGLDKDIAKMYGISKKAWKLQRSRNRGKKPLKKKLKSTKKRVVKTKRMKSMAKKKTKKRRKFTIPVAIVVPFASKFMSAIGHASRGDLENARKDLLWHFALIDSQGKFNKDAIKTWYGVAIGMGIHWIASKLGVNRALGRAGVPLLRI